MMQVTERLWVLLHEPEGPLTPYLDAFAKSLTGQGFKRHLLDRQIRVVANFSKWLQAEKVVAQDVTDEHARHFFEGSAHQLSVQRGDAATLRRLMRFLVKLDVIRPLPEHHEATPIQQAVRGFTAYLRQERALCEKTLIQYCPFVERFLSGCFGQGPVEFADLRAGDIIGFVRQQATHLSPARAKAATTALRSFFRYLRYCGEIQIDLAAAGPTVPSWSMTGIPRAITLEHLQGARGIQCRQVER